MAIERLVIGLAGMPGAGKSVVVKVAKESGYDVVVMGDIVREEAKRKFMKPSPENLGKIMLELRRKDGNNVIAKRCIPKIEKTRGHKVVVDGIRSLNEVEEFKRHFPRFSLLVIKASPETRFKRLYRRHRSDDPASWKVFLERDRRELSVGLGEAIAAAEYVLLNEEELIVLKERIREVLRKIEEKWIR
jgi:dephospho-CoA kinase